MDEARRELARCKDLDFGIEGHGCPFVFGGFEGEGWGQDFGYMVDTDFLMGLIRVFAGAERLSDLDGRACWVTHTHTAILLVEPLMKGEGTPFDIEAWRKDKKGGSA